MLCLARSKLSAHGSKNAEYIICYLFILRMENIDKNADILTILDGYKAYAADYEERKKKEEEEQKRRSAEEKKVIEENLRKKNIQDEIAETLRKIKEQEAEDAKVIKIYVYIL